MDHPSHKDAGTMETKDHAQLAADVVAAGTVHNEEREAAYEALWWTDSHNHTRRSCRA